VTEAAGLSNAGAGNYGMGVAVGDTTTTAFPILRHQLRKRTSFTTITATEPSPMSPPEQESRAVAGPSLRFFDYDNEAISIFL